MNILLSKSTMPIINLVAVILGWIMNGIYQVLDSLGIGNIALAIIIFTIIVYILMTPIQIKQQKMSKVMSVIQPELSQIQKKYQGKNDQASKMKMQEETMSLYSQYGASPTGSCLPMLVQFPLILGLYQVILHIPGYITKVGDIFGSLAGKMVKVNGYSEALTQFISDNKIRVAFRTKEALSQENIIDLLYMLKPSQWTKLGEISQFASMQSDMTAVAARSERINTFLNINISESPLDVIRVAVSNLMGGNVKAGVVVALVIAILIPFLAWFTQWLNLKLMPQQMGASGNEPNAMANSMKSMNTIMPVFSAVMCVTFSMGIGIYWVIGNIIRCVQQVVINNRIGSIDIEKMKQAASEKNAKKDEKRKDYTRNITANARVNVKHIETSKFDARKLQDVDYYKNVESAPADSITAKANMVRRFDEKLAEKKSGRVSEKKEKTDSIDHIE